MDSSSDEDIDILLRRASDKLGWSSQKNSNDTFEKLLKNVEESKKKKKPYSSRVRRQTPTSRRPQNSIPHSATEVPSTKRTLSFKNCTEKSSREALKNTLHETSGNIDSTTSLQTNLLLSAKDNSGVSKPDDHFEGIRSNAGNFFLSRNIETVGSEEEFDKCPSYKSKIDSPSFGGSTVEKTANYVEDINKENSWVDSNKKECGARTDKGAFVSPKCHQSWSQYREKDEESSDCEDEADGRKPAIKCDTPSGESSDEDDTDLPTLSLTQRLLKNYRSKKTLEGNDKVGPKRDVNPENRGQVLKETNDLTNNEDKNDKKSSCGGNFTSSDEEDFEKWSLGAHYKNVTSCYRQGTVGQSAYEVETVLLRMKTPVKSKPKISEGLDSDEDFINDEPLPEEDEDGPLFYYKQDNEEDTVSSVQTPSSVLRDQTNKSLENQAAFVRSSSDSSDDGDVFATPIRPKWIDKRKDKENSLSSFKTPVNKFLERKKESFLESLNTPPVGTPVRSPFVKDFKKKRTELTAKLFAMFNKTVFESKIPDNLEILWNKRMTKTAGYCVYTKRKFSSVREVRIELSEKVCDSAERLRDTLIHELCHAACWLIHGVNDGHGRFWKYWACKANVAHPEIPMVKRCHSYEIHTKFKYQCQQCKAIVGRHSKSLDVTKKCCGLCRGRFVLLPTGKGKEGKKQQPNKFAMFVKENYASIKKSNDRFKHADVMRVLGQEFARKATIAVD